MIFIYIKFFNSYLTYLSERFYFPFILNISNYFQLKISITNFSGALMPSCLNLIVDIWTIHPGNLLDYFLKAIRNVSKLKEELETSHLSFVLFSDRNLLYIQKIFKKGLYLIICITFITCFLLSNG